MKTCILAGVVVVIGFALGAVVAVCQVGISVDIPASTVGDSGATGYATDVKQPETYEGIPKAVVDKDVYEFGTMSSEDKKAKHDFVIRNEGKAPLKLGDVKKTCKCIVSSVTRKVLAPGETATVTVEWKVKGYFGPYEQVVNVDTNDPARPELTLKVKGRVTTPLRANPAEVVFSQISAGQTARTVTKLYAYKSKDLKILDISLQDPQTADFYKITSKPLSADVLREEKDALAGYELNIELKPGLPVGRFRQTIIVQTNLPEAPKLEIPIKGKIGSDISVVGRGWNEKTQSIRLGLLNRGEGAERTLQLIVRGKYRHHVDIEVAEVFPKDLLQATLGEPVSRTEGSVTRIPLTIRIPKNSGPANYIGSRLSPPGHILLRTTHPEIPEIKIPVSFAIEGG
jgi:hypothetical protein